MEGDYNPLSHLVDFIGVGFPIILAWSNGNERTDGPRENEEDPPNPPGRCGTNYRTTPPPACAKNPIHVGAINSDGGSMTEFSSWGPCDDGRLKPTVGAPGCAVRGHLVDSSLAFVPGTNPPGPSDTQFGGMCGTSMASPAVAGVISLFIQDWRAQGYGDPDERPLPALVKAMLVQTARDLGQPGPDFIYGYGAVDAVRLIELLRAGGSLEGSGNSFWGTDSVEQDQLDEYTLAVRLPTLWSTISISRWKRRTARLIRPGSSTGMLRMSRRRGTATASTIRNRSWSPCRRKASGRSASAEPACRRGDRKRTV
jgi:hypothetical protein